MNTWKGYLQSLQERFVGFFENPIIVVYFACIVFAVGSFGVWYPAFDFDYCSGNFFTSIPTLTNLSTYVISILAATMADFLLGKKERSNGFKIVAFSIFIFAFIAAVMSLIKFVWILGYLGLILTYILWVIVFVDDDSMVSEMDPNAASGGKDPEKQMLPGNLSDFKA